MDIHAALQVLAFRPQLPPFDLTFSFQFKRIKRCHT